MEEIFPGSKYIHIIRDGRGVAKSIIPLNWGPSAVETAAYWWMAFVSAGVVAEMNFGANALRVKYEDLLENFEDEIRRICDFCEIAFEQDMSNGSATSESGASPSVRRASIARRVLSLTAVNT